MATIEEQEKLMATLKFTPRKYRISFWGYGGEIVMGKIDRKAFDYFKHRRLGVPDYAWDYDYAEENNIPEEYQPFTPGSWYECDDMAHGSGVTRDGGTLQIDDENGNTVLERTLDSINGDDVQLSYNEEAWIGMANSGEVVFVGRSNEKGTFFEGDLDLTAPFDPEKLLLCFDEIDGEEYLTSVFYDDVEIDNWGGSTDGKSSEFSFFLVKDDKSWERYENYDSIDYPMTKWFPKKINPVRIGNYVVKTAGKNSYEYQAKWIGTKWVSTWAEESEYDNPDKEIKIKEWRGITYDPDAVEFDDKWDPVAELDKIVEQHKDVIEEIKLNPEAKWPF